MSTSSVDWLKIGLRAAPQLDIPVYTLGNGKPSIAITCAVHGDETAGMLIVAKLVSQLKSSSGIQGTIHIIPSANPAARFVNSRVAYLDLKDLNRVANGRVDGSYTERVGAVLFNFLKECDFVINIHEFIMHTPLCAAFLNAGEPAIRAKTLGAIRAFDPEFIWYIDSSRNRDAQYLATLDTALAEAGVANFPIEMSQAILLSDADIERVMRGLNNVLSFVGISGASQSENTVTPPAYVREEFTAPVAGVWEPKTALLQTVRQGDLIGTITALPDFEEEPIRAQKDGLIIQYRHHSVITIGESIFSFGHEKTIDEE